MPVNDWGGMPLPTRLPASLPAAHIALHLHPPPGGLRLGVGADGERPGHAPAKGVGRSVTTHAGLSRRLLRCSKPKGRLWIQACRNEGAGGARRPLNLQSGKADGMHCIGFLACIGIAQSLQHRWHRCKQPDPPNTLSPKAGAG